MTIATACPPGPWGLGLLRSAPAVGALAVYAATDAISVVIRHSLVQTRTPSEMPGRVIVVTGTWMRAFPQLTRIERLGPE
jgi:hypothetical protein